VYLAIYPHMFRKPEERAVVMPKRRIQQVAEQHRKPIFKLRGRE